MSTKKLQIIGSLGTGGEKIYKQNDEPIDAPDGALWVDLDETVEEEVQIDLDTTLSHEGKAADAKAVGDAIDNLEAIVSGKAPLEHDHNNIYYKKDEIDAIELIAVADIDAICGANIQYASINEVTF